MPENERLLTIRELKPYIGKINSIELRSKWLKGETITIDATELLEAQDAKTLSRTAREIIELIQSKRYHKDAGLGTKAINELIKHIESHYPKEYKP